VSYLKARNDRLGTVGLEIVLSVALGFLGGHWLDGKFGTHPYLTAVGFFLGLATAGRFLWQAAQRMKARTENDGFRKADAGRGARFALEQTDKLRQREKHDD
jgi:F0F1-type ATP synthase assembly protein I